MGGVLPTRVAGAKADKLVSSPAGEASSPAKVGRRRLAEAIHQQSSHAHAPQLTRLSESSTEVSQSAEPIHTDLEG